SDPDLISWGGKVQTTNCTQDIVSLDQSLGNPPSTMTIYVYQPNSSCGASPNVKTSVNYEYSADLYVYTNHKDARFGLIFAASSSTFSGSTFNADGNYYLLKIKASESDPNKITSYQLQETIGGSSTTPIAETNFATPLAPKQWNNFKVRHVGNTFTVFLNGTQLGSSASGSANWDLDRRKFGIFINVKSDNEGEPFEVFFDNVKVTELP
ncbi:MAG TPA: hypothetical protein VII92_01665, partial [Anaerolineae bacterium]